MVNIRAAQEGDREGVHNLLKEIDTEMNPRLSERNGGINILVEKMFRSNLVVAEDENKSIVGELAYTVKENTLYIHMTSIRQDFRNGLILYKMIEYCFANAESFDKIGTLTHPLNTRMQRILEKVGFQKKGVRSVKSDSEPRLIYEAEASSIKKYIK